MPDYGFSMTYYPAGVSSDRSLIVFEMKTYEGNKPVRFQEILDCEWDIPTSYEMQAPEIPWMAAVLYEALQMLDDAAALDDDVSDIPTVVKSYLASGKKMLGD